MKQFNGHKLRSESNNFYIIQRSRQSEKYIVCMFDNFYLNFNFRCCGATVINRTDEIREEDLGSECGLFEVEKIGDE